MLCLLLIHEACIGTTRRRRFWQPGHVSRYTHMTPSWSPLDVWGLTSKILFLALVNAKRQAMAAAKMISTTIWPSVYLFLNRDPTRGVGSHEREETILPWAILGVSVVGVLGYQNLDDEGERIVEEGQEDFSLTAMILPASKIRIHREYGPSSRGEKVQYSMRLVPDSCSKLGLTGIGGDGHWPPNHLAFVRLCSVVPGAQVLRGRLEPYQSDALREKNLGEIWAKTSPRRLEKLRAVRLLIHHTFRNCRWQIVHKSARTICRSIMIKKADSEKLKIEPKGSAAAQLNEIPKILWSRVLLHILRECTNDRPSITG